jgi:3-oxoacyl-[acyl-carrier protein] reductase
MRDRGDKPQVVWITGAAGGLGQALAAAFVDNGWRVLASYHDTPLSQKHENIWPIQVDITQQKSVHNAILEVNEEWGGIGLLINNAGMVSDQNLSQMSQAQWDTVIDVNLRGAMYCTQAVLPIMQQNRQGHIINISSYAGRVGSAGQSNYAAAKAGLLGLTVSLAKELGEYNILVNAVLPGVLITPMTAQLSTAQKDRFIQANALKRLNSVEEVSRFIVFLAGMKNVSGQIFQLDSRIAPWS